MHFFLTNDDGYEHIGFRTLIRTLIARGHRVSFGAPDRQRSAASHAFAIHTPLRAYPAEAEGARGWAIDGTPADCTRLGLFLLGEDKPDLCISGINQGSNLGGACIYSGTVNAALEASMAGCPALAASLDSFTQKDFTYAAELTEKTARWAVAHPLKRGEIYNLNVPDLVPCRGVRFTRIMAPEYLSAPRYERFTSEYGETYYFLTDGENHEPFPENSDSVLCRAGYACISVLTWDMSAKCGDVDFTGWDE